jgi:hypothetical protein
VAFAALEPFGYTQLSALFRTLGLVDALRRRGSWGTMPRRGFRAAEARPQTAAAMPRPDGP